MQECREKQVYALPLSFLFCADPQPAPCRGQIVPFPDRAATIMRNHRGPRRDRAPLNSPDPLAIPPPHDKTGPGASRDCAVGRKSTDFRGLPMSSTFDTVANIIAETCDIEREKITPESHAIDDLGIDSLDFLDIAFAIDKAFGIKLPLEQWTQEVNDGKATTEQYFVLKNLCARIDGLVAAKGA